MNDQRRTDADHLKLLSIFHFIGAWLLASAILSLISGLCPRARKYRTFSLVFAGINCVHLPLGTVPGFFTIITVMRASVRDHYEAWNANLFFVRVVLFK